jgi:hypothetical protein
MKYKYLFLVWLLAEVILGIGAFIAVIAQTAFSSHVFNKDYGMIFMVIGLSLLWSFPSLLVMWLFHFLYSQKHPYLKSYFKIYSIVIITINVLYALCSRFIFTMNTEFLLYFIFTTIAGLLALYFVTLKIKKKEREQLIA